MNGWLSALNWLALAAGAVALVGLLLRQRGRLHRVSDENRALERRLAEREAAADELATRALAVAQCPLSIIITDPVGRIEYVNPKFELTTGYGLAELAGRGQEFLDSGYGSGSRASGELWQAVATGSEWRGELHSRRKNGELFWEYAVVSPISGPDGRLAHMLAVGEDITVRKQYEEQLLHKAHYDDLTGLPNRVLAFDRLDRATLQNRKNDRIVGVLFGDLDNFKFVNDSLGHVNGDRLLVAAASRMSSALRASDTVARLGGDEFLIILPELRDPVDAEIAADKILKAFFEPFDLDGSDVMMTLSLGITISPADGTDAHVLLSNADAAMYKAKETGRNAYSFFTPAMNEDAARRHDLGMHLAQALEHGDLELRFQPILDGGGDRLLGAEALLAWEDPALGRVPADQFVPVAEETGLIVPIGEWVLREACREARRWREKTGEELRVAVNVSPRQFMEADLVASTRAALAASGLAPASLELEVTERLIVEDNRDNAGKLHDLAELGVRLSLDDFGTGYSSLAHLHDYPFDTVKIDRALVAGLTTDSAAERMASAIVALGHSLGLEVLAEGVETEEQRRRLAEMGCDLLQGYLFSPAVEADAIAELQPGDGRRSQRTAGG